MILVRHPFGTDEGDRYRGKGCHIEKTSTQGEFILHEEVKKEAPVRPLHPREPQVMEPILWRYQPLPLPRCKGASELLTRRYGRSDVAILVGIEIDGLRVNQGSLAVW